MYTIKALPKNYARVALKNISNIYNDDGTSL